VEKASSSWHKTARGPIHSPTRKLRIKNWKIALNFLVMGTLVQEPNIRTVSFTTQTVTILLSDNDPRSVVTRALFTENPHSGDALLPLQQNSDFGTSFLPLCQPY